MIFPFNLFQNNDAQIAEVKAVVEKIASEQAASLTAKQKANSVVSKSPYNTYKQIIDLSVTKLNEYFAELFENMDFELAPKQDPKNLKGEITPGLYEVLNVYRKVGKVGKTKLVTLILYPLTDKHLALPSYDEDPIEKALRAIAHATSTQASTAPQSTAPTTPPSTTPQPPTSTPTTPSSLRPYIRYIGSPNIFSRETGEYINPGTAGAVEALKPNMTEDISTPRPEVHTGSDYALWNGKDLTTGIYAPPVSTPPPVTTTPQVPLPTPQVLALPTNQNQITKDLFDQLGIGLYHMTPSPGYSEQWLATDKGVVHNLERSTAEFLGSIGITINERMAAVGIQGYNTSGGNTVNIAYILNSFAQLTANQRAAEDQARINRLNNFIDQYRGTTTTIDIPANLDPSGRYIIRNGIFMMK